jgi:hypothetical protein
MSAPSGALRVALLSFAFGALASGCPGGDPDADSGVQDEDSGVSEADGGSPPDAGPAPDAGAEDPPVPPSGTFGWVAHPEVDALMADRWAPAIADLGGGRALVFGGADIDSFGGSPLDDVYRFDGRGAVPTFTPVELSSTNPLDPPLSPDPRYCGCAAFDPLRNEVLVIGGRSLQTFYTDIWRLDLDNNTFTEVGQGPAALLGCAITWHPADDSFYLFGGASMSGSSNTLYRLASGEDTFSPVAVTSDAEPSPRYDPWMGSDGTRLIMAGGARNAQQDFNGDVWAFDPSTGAWLELAANGEGPVGRRVPWAHLSSTGDRLVFGFGNNGGEVLDDLWTYDLNADTWTEHTLDPAPPARGWSPPLPGGDDVIGYLLGGFDLGDPVADLWRLDADADDPGF